MVQNPLKSFRPTAQSSVVHEVEIIYSAPKLLFPAPLVDSETCVEFFRRVYDPRKICLKEFFYVTLVNNANYCIGYSQIGMGTDSGVLVNVKEIIQLAILGNATGIIVSHNHPSGNLKPSRNDKAITQRLKAGAALFDIQLLDHIILTHEEYFSFADEGLM